MGSSESTVPVIKTRPGRVGEGDGGSFGEPSGSSVGGEERTAVTASLHKPFGPVRADLGWYLGLVEEITPGRVAGSVLLALLAAGIVIGRHAPRPAAPAAPSSGPVALAPVGVNR
jgi:hypothetical protein